MSRETRGKDSWQHNSVLKHEPFLESFVLHRVHVSITCEICYRDRHHVKGERRKGGDHDQGRMEQSGILRKNDEIN